MSLYPRDWVRISQHVGVEAHGSKCRKRWARIQEKHRKSLLLATSVNSANGSSNTIAVHDAADGVSDGGGGVGLDIYDRVDSGHSFSFGDPRDGGDGYEDLGDMDGGLDLEEEGHH